MHSAKQRTAVAAACSNSCYINVINTQPICALFHNYIFFRCYCSSSARVIFFRIIHAHKEFLNNRPSERAVLSHNDINSQHHSGE